MDEAIVRKVGSAMPFSNLSYPPGPYRSGSQSARIELYRF